MHLTECLTVCPYVCHTVVVPFRPKRLKAKQIRINMYCNHSSWIKLGCSGCQCDPVVKGQGHIYLTSVKTCLTARNANSVFII